MKTYIVDGYNLLWKLFPEKMTAAGIEKARKELEGAIQEFLSLAGGSQALLVYDGEGSGSKLSDPQWGLRICFSPGGVTADERILDLAQQYSGKGEVYVVTSDLKDIARRLGGIRAVHISSETFRDKLAQSQNTARRDDPGEAETDEKPPAPKGGEIESWLQDFDMKE